MDLFMNEILEFIKEHAFLIALAGVGLIFAIIIFSLVTTRNRKDRDEYNNIISSLTIPRVFICNLGADEVVYFDRGLYHKQKRGPMTQFYEQFTARERDELEKWIALLLSPKSGVSLYHKFDVFLKNEKRSYVSLLEVKRIDYERKIIHLESYLYRYLRPTNQINLSLRRRENKAYLQEEELVKLFNRRFRRGSGSYASINIVNKVVTQESGTNIPAHLIYELRNQAAFYRGKRVIVYFANNTHIGLYFPFASEADELLKVVKNIINKMLGYLELNGHEDFSLSAGIVGHHNQLSDLTTMIKTAEELSDFAQHEKDKVLIYNPKRESKDFDLSVYRSEVARIISRKSVEPLFQPLLSATSADIHGYLVSFALSSPLFSNYDQLALFVRENKEIEGLAQMVIRKSSATYYSKRRNANHKLFMPLDVGEYPAFLKMKAMQEIFKEIKFVFVITEDSFSENFRSVSDMIPFVTRLKEYGHELALLITDTELNLPDDLYSRADYFMVDERIVEPAQKDERELLYLLASLGKLLRHKKKIVVSGILKWSEIEYYIRAGVDFIASNEISKKDYNLQTIEKKKAMRIINFSRRLN